MDISLMVPAHAGLNWESWRHILALAERLQIPSVFRSDHYFVRHQDVDSLEAYLSFAVAAAETSTVRFGPLVSPVTFRHPVDMARMAAQIDLLSGGRFVLGLGAGWSQVEHEAHGLPFPGLKERFDRLDDALRMMRVMWAESPANYAGAFYPLEGVDMWPKPAAGRPPILIGGMGEKRTLRIVAEHADEWNAINLTPEAYAQKVTVLDRHCEAVGRDPATIRRSFDTSAMIGPDAAVQDAATSAVRYWLAPDLPEEPAAARAEAATRGFLTGGRDEIVDWLGQLSRLGVSEVQFLHVLMDRDDVPEYLASEIAPQVKDL